MPKGVLLVVVVATIPLQCCGVAGHPRRQTTAADSSNLAKSAMIGVEADLLLEMIGTASFHLRELSSSWAPSTSAASSHRHAPSAAHVALLQGASTSSLLQKDVSLLRSSLTSPAVRLSPVVQGLLEKSILRASGAAATLEEELGKLSVAVRGSDPQSETSPVGISMPMKLLQQQKPAPAAAAAATTSSLAAHTSLSSQASLTTSPAPGQQVAKGFQKLLAQRLTLDGALPWPQAIIMWMGVYLTIVLCIILVAACVMPQKRARHHVK
mmetsp:Transcript_54313/g.129429  ORF Transcript_54313/g.129429 Transcript_54313/m.129429 type:complete len:268 (+) Transcript_54313:113-916(+)